MNFEDSVWSYDISPAVEEIHAKYVDSFTDNQKSKINELRSRMGDVLRPKIHNDFFLSKWLVAKKWNLDAATTMLKAHFKWREEFEVDHIHEDYDPPQLFVKYVPIGIVGDAKNGSPFYIFNMGSIDPMGLFSSGEPKELLRYVIYQMEYGQQLQLVNTEKCGQVVNNYTAILDLEKFPYKDFIWKTFLDILIAVFTMIEDHYPGIIGKLFVINVSRIFTLFYGIFKPFFREDTKNRILIFGKDSWKEALMECVNPDQVPVYWGGLKVDEVDGNHYCSSQVSIGGPVPKSYYKSSQRRRSEINDMHSVKVANRELFAVDVDVAEEGSTLSWSFWTEEHDIGFGVNKGATTLLPIKRYQCELVPEKGTLLCQESGTYSLIFDNSFSIYRSKKLSYEVQVIPEIEESTYL